MDDYFLFSNVRKFNETSFHITSNSFDHSNTFNGFYFSSMIKCFSIILKDKNYKEIKALWSFYDRQKLMRDFGYYDGTRQGYYHSVHYPGQFLLGDEFLHYKPITQHSIFKIDELEVLQRRSNHRKKCHDDSNGYDNRIAYQYISRIGCQPPYLDYKSSFPVCQTMKEMKESKFEYHKIQSQEYETDCLIISKKVLQPIKLSKLNAPESAAVFGIFFPKTIRIITLSKEIDIHALIGNIGGYLGLFLGN